MIPIQIPHTCSLELESEDMNSIHIPLHLVVLVTMIKTSSVLLFDKDLHLANGLELTDGRYLLRHSYHFYALCCVRLVLDEVLVAL